MEKLTHNDFINKAIECAKESVACGGFTYGAVVVNNGKIIADSKIRRLPGNINHAETNAIANALDVLGTNDLIGCMLYSSCKPCGFCMGAIKWVGITEIYYAMDKSDADSIGYSDEIFFDETVQILDHKITNPDLLEYMKNWYGSRD